MKSRSRLVNVGIALATVAIVAFTIWYFMKNVRVDSFDESDYSIYELDDADAGADADAGEFGTDTVDSSVDNVFEESVTDVNGIVFQPLSDYVPDLSLELQSDAANSATTTSRECAIYNVPTSGIALCDSGWHLISSFILNLYLKTSLSTDNRNIINSIITWRKTQPKGNKMCKATMPNWKQPVKYTSSQTPHNTAIPYPTFDTTTNPANNPSSGLSISNGSWPSCFLNVTDGSDPTKVAQQWVGQYTNIATPGSKVNPGFGDNNTYAEVSFNTLTFDSFLTNPNRDPNKKVLTQSFICDPARLTASPTLTLTKFIKLTVDPNGILRGFDLVSYDTTANPPLPSVLINKGDLTSETNMRQYSKLFTYVQIGTTIFINSMVYNNATLYKFAVDMCGAVIKMGTYGVTPTAPSKNYLSLQGSFGMAKKTFLYDFDTISQASEYYDLLKKRLNTRRNLRPEEDTDTSDDPVISQIEILFDAVVKNEIGKLKNAPKCNNVNIYGASSFFAGSSEAPDIDDVNGYIFISVGPDFTGQTTDAIANNIYNNDVLATNASYKQKLMANIATISNAPYKFNTLASYNPADTTVSVEYTTMFWLRVDKLPNNNVPVNIFSHGVPTAQPTQQPFDIQPAAFLERTSSGQSRIRFIMSSKYHRDTFNSFFCNLDSVIPVGWKPTSYKGNWFHVAIVVSYNSVTIYLNGVPNTTYTGPGKKVMTKTTDQYGDSSVSLADIYNITTGARNNQDDVFVWGAAGKQVMVNMQYFANTDASAPSSIGLQGLLWDNFAMVTSEVVKRFQNNKPDISADPQPPPPPPPPPAAPSTTVSSSSDYVASAPSQPPPQLPAREPILNPVPVGPTPSGVVGGCINTPAWKPKEISKDLSSKVDYLNTLLKNDAIKYNHKYYSINRHLNKNNKHTIYFYDTCTFSSNMSERTTYSVPP